MDSHHNMVCCGGSWDDELGVQFDVQVKQKYILHYKKLKVNLFILMLLSYLYKKFILLFFIFSKTVLCSAINLPKKLKWDERSDNSIANIRLENFSTHITYDNKINNLLYKNKKLLTKTIFAIVPNLYILSIIEPIR